MGVMMRMRMEVRIRMRGVLGDDVRMGTRTDGHAPKGQCRNQWLFRAWVSSRPASIRPSLKVSFDTAKKDQCRQGGRGTVQGLNFEHSLESWVQQKRCSHRKDRRTWAIASCTAH